MPGLPDIPIGQHRAYECSWERIGDSDDWILGCPVVDADLEETSYAAVTDRETSFLVDGASVSADAFLDQMHRLWGFELITVVTPGRVARIEYGTRSDG